MSLLHLTIGCKNYEALETLLKIDNRLQHWGTDCFERNVFHMACNFFDNKSLQILYRRGKFNIDFFNQKNQNGESAFHNICFIGCKDLVQELIEKDGIIFNSSCNTGNTPFIMSIFSKNMELVKLLHEKKVNIKQKNRFGYDALQLACLNNFFDGAKQLIKWGVNIDTKNNECNTPLIFAILVNSIDIFHLLLDNKADVHSVNTNGCTPLHVAVQVNNVEFVRRLLKNGAKTNTRNKRHLTPLTEAGCLQRTELVQILLEYATHEAVCSAYKLVKMNKLDIIAEIIEKYMETHDIT